MPMQDLGLHELQRVTTIRGYCMVIICQRRFERKRPLICLVGAEMVMNLEHMVISEERILNTELIGEAVTFVC